VYFLLNFRAGNSLAGNYREALTLALALSLVPSRSPDLPTIDIGANRGNVE